MKKLIITVCIAFLLICCGPKQDGVDRYIEDGVEIVANNSEQNTMEKLRPLSLEKILTIDTEANTIVDLGIPDIFGFDVNSFGDIYILRNVQGDGNFIFKFNSNGNFVKSFGRQGQGPGEFQNPHHIAIDHNDNILVFDMGPQILHKYDQNGVLLDDYKMKSGETRITSGPKNTLLAFVHSSEQDNGRTINTLILKLINPEFDELNDIDAFIFEWRRDKPNLIWPIFCWGVSNENIYIVNEKRGYEIWVHDCNGKLTRKIKKNHSLVPVSDSYKEEALKQFPAEMREHMRELVYFPEFHHPIQNLIVGDDGVLLVATYERGVNPGEFLYDIFDRDGVFAGRISLNIFIWEGHLWARIKDNKLYSLKVKDNGFRVLCVHRMIWE